jgi:hypothetical protein
VAYFPMVLWAHFVAVCRIRGHMARAAVVVLAGTALELAGTAVGAVTHGLVGLAAGLAVAKTLEGIVAAPTVTRALRTAGQLPQPADDGRGHP